MYFNATKLVTQAWNYFPINQVEQNFDNQRTRIRMIPKKIKFHPIPCIYLGRQHQGCFVPSLIDISDLVLEKKVCK